MNIAVTGSSGLLGSALVRYLRATGHRVIRLVRRRPVDSDEVLWYPEVDAEGIAGVDAVVHLVGEPLSGRWIEEQRDAIRDSRIGGTATLAEGLAAMTDRPRALLCASATGFYGDRGSVELTEDSGPGTGFLADVFRATEAAAKPAADAGIRVSHLRFGVLQSAQGGGLPILLPAFRRGFGVLAGNGRQFVSWVSLPDAVRAVAHVLDRDTLGGPVNVTSPEPLTNREYADTLARVLGRPRLLAAPPRVVRWVFGAGVADEVLLASVRAVPARLLASGFRFEYPSLDMALKNTLLGVTCVDERR